MSRFIRRLRYLLRSHDAEAELREELEFHRAERQRQLERQGVPAAEAAKDSRRALGNTTLACEDSRAIWLWPWLESVWQDAVYAVRGLRREPGFTLIAVIALGSAIGLNTSLYTTLNAFLWRPWPVQDPGRVVTLIDENGRATFTLAERDHFATYGRTVSGVIATRCLDGLSEGCLLKLADENISVDFVTPNYFQVLGIGMSRGAGFSSDLKPGDPVAVLSDRAWRVRFGADSSIVGRQITLDDVGFTIVGVAAAGFNGTSLDRKDLWIPISAMPRLRPDYVFDDVKRAAAVSARLADGVTASQAASELNTLNLQFRKDRGLDPHRVGLIGTTFFPNPAKRRNADGVVTMMFAAVFLVLGLACANVANLLLARGAARQRETGARLALGASRARIVRQLLTESLILATAATAIGIALAYVLPPVIVAQVATQPLALAFEPDRRVLGFAVGLALAACIGFGLVPALHASRAEISTTLKEKAGLPSARVPLRALLLTFQIAVSIVLLVCGSLIVRGVQRVTAQDPGFDMTGVSVVSFELPGSYTTARLRGFALQIVENAPPLLSRRSAGLADTAPFVQGSGMWITARMPGARESRDDDVLKLEVSDGYFDALRIPVVAGRNFQPGDGDSGAVLISESIARRLWPSSSAVGRRIEIGSGSKSTSSVHDERLILGVVKDVNTYYGSVTTAFPTVYMPTAGRTIPKLIVRDLDPGLTQAITAFATRIEPRTRIVVTSIAENLDKRLSEGRVGAWVAGVLGLLSVALAGLGVFSVFAYTVEQRTSEIGIRLALGARPAQVVSTILTSNAAALLGGLAVGIVAAVAAARVIRSLLYGLSPFDPISYVAVAAVLAVIAIAATILPARRATRIDPIVALRCE